MSRPSPDAATVSDFCKCGHQRHLHMETPHALALGQSHACTGKVDKRPPNVGGSECYSHR